MRFASSEITSSTAYRLLTSTVVPRPIAFVTTLGKDGIVNAAPFSFFNAVGSSPPVLVLGFEPKVDNSVKDTPRNIIETKEFVINIVNEALAVQMNICAGNFTQDQSEIEIANINVTESTEVKPPRIQASPVSMECKLFQHTALEGGGCVIIGEVVQFHVQDDIILQRDPLRIDVNKLNPIARLAGPDYARITDQFQIQRPK
ncbi:flavin reductase family protein [Kordiimonas laminariae]|uniref:flavin reductase family protein n=1 Tax=Kordiimonas laminariae TaxID=2917717 RepID=UPI001FF5AB9C|nr:flavin reductase family protein [Kordiimonas laminariae]MCK0069163.1 flavin reductase family protein [Kordiimonas laminariae]